MERYEPYWNREEHRGRLKVLYEEQKIASRARAKMRRQMDDAKRQGLTARIRQMIRMIGGIREVPSRI